GRALHLVVEHGEVVRRSVADVARDERQVVLEADDPHGVAVGNLPAPRLVDAPAGPLVRDRHVLQSYHLYSIPVRSSSAVRHWIRSATARLEPHAIVQPIWPCPVLKNRFAYRRPRPITGGPSGVIGRRQAPRSPAE